MRIIFSRKGFDSAAGGVPSPVINGRPVSLPIPTRMPTLTRFADLANGISQLVSDLTSGRISPDQAAVGELVLAFAGRTVNSVEPHGVVWAGIVAEKITIAEYWNDKRFAGKKPDRCNHPDNFYRPDEGGLVWVANKVHPQEATRRDTSGQYVLIFNPAWHFGAHGPLLPQDFGLRMVNGRRGERVADLAQEEWRRLEVWLHDQCEVSGMPVDARRACGPKRAPRVPATITPRRRC